MTIKLATIFDAKLIKNLINEMYGIEYEKREIKDIQKDIQENKQIYTIAYSNGEPVGFAGASTESDEYVDIIKETKVVLDYVYVKEKFRGLSVAFELMKMLINQLVEKGFNSALMQVQTFNKQRFLHYALSDKNIIKTIENKDFNDEILLVKDLIEILNLEFKAFLRKVKTYLDQEKELKENNN